MLFSCLAELPGDFHKKLKVCPQYNEFPPPMTEEDDNPAEAKLMDKASRTLSALAQDLEDTGMKDRRTLRAQLMIEELAETIEAMADGNIEQTFDGLLDLAYVLGGTFEVFGFRNVMEAGFAEVHRANMDKQGGDDTDRVRTKGDDWQPPQLIQILQQGGHLFR